ncbi:MAG: substrate-binding domain-containing protein [Chloroflexi bacterium]|nr:substrate-binding domain-containing protein [Chloroflexota bacterium]
MKTALRLMVGALALAILSTGMASRSDASATTPVITAGSKGVIQGSGATFPATQYNKWITDIHAASPSVGFGTSSATALNITYGGGGSGAGKTAFFGSNARKESNMFNGTDSMLSAAQEAKRGSADLDFIMVPMTAGPIAIIVNLPGITTTLKMNAEVICGIYSGEIKLWNDSKITALNPTVKALKTMSQTIVPVARDATSGTTSIFSTYLATGASAAQNKCGYTSDWTNTVTSFSSLSGTILPAEAIMKTRFAAMRTANGATQTIENATGNEGIQAKVQSTSYSLGYVEVSYTSGSNIRQVALATKSLNTTGANAGKPNYLTATAAGATAALARHLADATGTGESPINPGYAQFLQPVNQLGLTSYPIVGYSWVLVYKNYVSTVTDAPTKGQVEGLIYFLNWSLVKGKAATVGSTTTKAYAPLPASVKAAVIAQLKLVKYDGVTVWR